MQADWHENNTKAATGVHLKVGLPRRHYNAGMKRFLALAILACSALVASRTDYLNAKRKFESIEQFQTKPGSRVPLPSSELNAYVQVELPAVAPQGVRDPKVELRGNNIAVGRAFINF